jgi:hypothetical protein
MLVKLSNYMEFTLPSKQFIIVKKGTTIIESRYYHDECLFDGLETSDPHYEVPTPFKLQSVAVKYNDAGEIKFYEDNILLQTYEKDLLDNIRKKRNSLLTSCDWTRLDDVQLTEEKKQAWASYRQELRNFPETCDIYNPEWPVPPV